MAELKQIGSWIEYEIERFGMKQGRGGARQHAVFENGKWQQRGFVAPDKIPEPFKSYFEKPAMPGVDADAGTSQEEILSFINGAEGGVSLEDVIKKFDSEYEKPVDMASLQTVVTLLNKESVTLEEAQLINEWRIADQERRIANVKTRLLYEARLAELIANGLLKGEGYRYFAVKQANASDEFDDDGPELPARTIDEPKKEVEIETPPEVIQTPPSKEPPRIWKPEPKYKYPWRHSRDLKLIPRDEEGPVKTYADTEDFSEAGEDSRKYSIGYEALKKRGMICYSVSKAEAEGYEKRKDYYLTDTNDGALKEPFVHGFYGDAPDFLRFKYTRIVGGKAKFYIEMRDNRGQWKPYKHTPIAYPFKLGIRGPIYTEDEDSI